MAPRWKKLSVFILRPKLVVSVSLWPSSRDGNAARSVCNVGGCIPQVDLALRPPHTTRGLMPCFSPPFGPESDERERAAFDAPFVCGLCNNGPASHFSIKHIVATGAGQAAQNFCLVLRPRFLRVWILLDDF